MPRNEFDQTPREDDYVPPVEAEDLVVDFSANTEQFQKGVLETLEELQLIEFSPTRQAQIDAMKKNLPEG